MGCVSASRIVATATTTAATDRTSGHVTGHRSQSPVFATGTTNFSAVTVDAFQTMNAATAWTTAVTSRAAPRRRPATCYFGQFKCDNGECVSSSRRSCMQVDIWTWLKDLLLLSPPILEPLSFLNRPQGVQATDPTGIYDSKQSKARADQGSFRKLGREIRKVNLIHSVSVTEYASAETLEYSDNDWWGTVSSTKDGSSSWQQFSKRERHTSRKHKDLLMGW